ncbi:MAG: hypothetical protein JSS89_01310 [Bacteroidetes bacterium]|nr:hypothetical protein [Bacteroidota bacterium]
MKSLYKRLVAVLGATGICVMLMVGCGGQKPAEEVKTGGAVIDSMGGGNSYNFTTVPQPGTLSYPTDTRANKIDLSVWIVSGTAPNPGALAPNTIVNVTSMSPVPGKTGLPPKPALPLSAITDQPVQVTSDDTTSVAKPK